MMNGVTKITLAASLLAGLAGCGNDSENAGPFGALAQTAGQIVAQRRAADQPAAPAKSPQDAAAEALRVNPGPLIQAGFESLGRTQVMAMTGQNGALRTYMTPAEEALILRGGMLVGTRGLGHDMSATEAGRSAALIRAGQSGQAQRTLRYYAADGRERPLPFTCRIGPGPKAGVMVESCEGNGVSFQNNYMVSGSAITVSRQWGGPGLGYLTIQTLRP